MLTKADLEHWADEDVKKYPHLRMGQALMNNLYLHDPVTYRELCNTKVDCFYEDSRIPIFWESLTNRGIQ